jgi:CelD/BcsL family acetyltransferase involved in cellulose biosynthesis
VEIEVVESLSRFQAVGPEWDALAERFERPLLRHDWLVSCAEALHHERDLRVVTVRRGDRLVAAAPLVVVPDGVVNRIGLLGMSALHEPSGLLYEDQSSLEVLAKGVVGLGRAVVLQRLEADGPAPSALRAAAGPLGRGIVRRTGEAAAIVVTQSWEEYSRTLSSHITSNLRRQRARAARLGTVSAEVLTPAEADVDGLLQIVIDVEGSGWKGRNGSALRCRPDLRAFFAGYARRAARAGRLRIAILRIGDRVAAVELAVEDFRRWWQLKIGYADELRQYYPGLLLTLETVRRAFEHRLDSFEFLGSAAEWEARWNPALRRYEVCVVYPPTVKGGLALAGDVVELVGRRLRRSATARPSEGHTPEPAA